MTPEYLAHKKRVGLVTQQRLEILERCKTDLVFRSLCIERCKKDIIFFIEYFCCGYNPREKPSILPMVLFPRQIELLQFMEDNYQNKVNTFATVVKARYIGASVLSALFLTYHLLYSNDFTGGFASNKTASVDTRGSLDTLFGKIDLVLDLLPKWMNPIDRDKDRKLMLIKNTTNNSRILGASGDQIGRGGRTSTFIIDEFAFVERSSRVIAAVSENTDNCFLISTPNGIGNKFWEMCNNSNIPNFRYHWSADLRRTPEWREQKTLELGSVIANQELECSFETDAGDALISYEWIMAAIDSHLKIEGLEDEDGNKQVGLDVAVSGSNKSVLTFRIGSVVEQIIELPGQDTTQSAFLADRMVTEEGYDYLCFDADGVGAGVAATLNNIERLQYSILEFHGASKPTERSIKGMNRLACDVYANLRAEAWSNLRIRFKNTYDHLTGAVEHEPHDMISIPNEPKLIQDLTKPKIKYQNNGKLLLESKVDMKKRGISSPDYGDSLALAFHEGISLDWVNWW